MQALADAPLADVLKAWEGCGYYARARNLHRAAQVIAQQGFPEAYGGWLALPGVGPYTAAALSSLTLNETRAVNDGNVRRVLARLHAEPQPTPRWVQAQADALLDPARPGAWNEAVMDLGATVCTPDDRSAATAPQPLVRRAGQRSAHGLSCPEGPPGRPGGPRRRRPDRHAAAGRPGTA